MPQQSQVCYYESRAAFYTQFQGKRRLLAKGPNDYPDGPTYQAALKAFNRLMAGGDIKRAGDESQSNLF
jgi:hypothetical protein